MTRRDSLLLLPAGAALAQEPPREPLPKFTAKDLDGATHTKESLRGKVILIQHWATWCGFCRKDEPAVESIISDHAAQGLVVLAVNAGEPKAAVQAYLREHKRSARVVLGPDTNLGRLFDGAGLPAYLLIDRDGLVAHGQAGAGGLPALHEMMRIVKLRK
jgi:thiol-disulfide isomerase/thioredoxin